MFRGAVVQYYGVYQWSEVCVDLTFPMLKALDQSPSFSFVCHTRLCGSIFRHQKGISMLYSRCYDPFGWFSCMFWFQGTSTENHGFYIISWSLHIFTPKSIGISQDVSDLLWNTQRRSRRPDPCVGCRGTSHLKPTAGQRKSHGGCLDHSTTYDQQYVVICGV